MVRQESIINRVKQYLKERGAEKIAVYGSFARNEMKPDSDIDILVTFNEAKSLFEILGMEQDLSDQLGVRIDLQTEKSISPYLMNAIKNEMRAVYP